jgi:hypothetical protein
MKEGSSMMIEGMERVMSYFVSYLYEQAAKDGNWQKAFDKLDDYTRQLAQKQQELAKSRFLRISQSEEGPSLHKATQRSISEHYDMADCRNGEGDDERFLYLDDDDNLYPIVIGKLERINTDQEYPLHYGASDILAHGKTVGSITYTDH